MNDLVRASSLFGGPRSPTAAPSGVLGTVSNPPPQAPQLPVGTTLRGVVTGHDSEGRLLVRTEIGTLSVATKAQLPVNSEVTLQIRSSGAQLHVLLMHSEVQPGGAQGAPAQSVQAAAPHGGEPQGRPVGASGAGQAAPGSHGAPPDVLTLGQTVRAVVQAPAAAPGAAPDLASNILAGTASGTAAPGASGRAGAAAVAGGPALSAVATQLTAGSELQLRIVTVQAPAQALAAQTAGPGAAGGLAAYGALQGGTGPGATASTAQPPGQPGARGTTPNGQAAHPSTRTLAPGLTARPFTQAPPSGVAAVAGQPATLAGAPSALGPAAPGGNAPGGPMLEAGVPAAGTPAQPPAALSGATSNALRGTSPVAPAPGTAALAPALLTSYAATGAGQTTTPATAPGAAPQGASQGTAPGSTPAASTSPLSRGTAQPTTLPGAGAATASPAATTAMGTAPSGDGAGPGALRFTGTVTAVTHAGQPVLQTPLGTLTLEIQALLPIGSRVTLELPAQAFLQSTPAGAPQAPASLGTLAHAWPALEEALQLLQEIAVTGAGAPAAPETLPQPGPKLASGLLFFLAALSAGDVGRWLGHQATQALKSTGRETLLSRLGQDFGQLSRLAENPGGDWRLFFIPLLDGDQLQQLRLFLRHGQQGHGGNDGEKDDEPTRFIVEVELSRLGDLQLDGLVRDKRLDLILRTRAPLPEFMRHDIAQIFQDANDATGYDGNIGFQSSATWSFMPIEAPEVDSPGVVV